MKAWGRQLQAAGEKCKGPWAGWAGVLQNRRGDDRAGGESGEGQGPEGWGRWLAAPPFLRARLCHRGPAWACAALRWVWAVPADGAAWSALSFLHPEPRRGLSAQTDWPRLGGAHSSPPVVGSVGSPPPDLPKSRALVPGKATYLGERPLAAGTRARVLRAQLGLRMPLTLTTGVLVRKQGDTGTEAGQRRPGDDRAAQPGPTEGEPGPACTSVGLRLPASELGEQKRGVWEPPRGSCRSSPGTLRLGPREMRPGPPGTTRSSLGSLLGPSLGGGAYGASRVKEIWGSHVPPKFGQVTCL